MAHSTASDISPLLHTGIPNIQHYPPPNETSPVTRQPFRRQSSYQGNNDQAIYHEQETARDESDIGTRGLGLASFPSTQRTNSIPRVPVGSRNSLVSPVSPEITRYSQLQPNYNLSQVPTLADDHLQQGKWLTPEVSSYSVNDSTYRQIPDNTHLIAHTPHDDDCNHNGACPTVRSQLKEKWSWLTYVIIILAVYTTLLSALFLIIAIWRPRWGHRIGTKGNLSYNTATFLSALLSKSIELSFATTFVATLGQILSRRAFVNDTKRQGGISIAEMNMRLWIMQPGTLITHWDGIKYVFRTFLGIAALLAALSATFYTTAAEALVAPKLKFGANETMTLYGQVSAGYANAVWLKEHCETTDATYDPANTGNNCLQIDYAGNAFRNFGSWRNTWAERQALNLSDEDAKKVPRPPPISILYENTTVTGRWIGDMYQSVEEDSKANKRLFQNLTMVMPHANVYHALRDPKNGIIQPSDLGGAGEFAISAAVPAPALQVLCVGAQESELEPQVGNSTNDPRWRGFPEGVSDTLSGYFGWNGTADGHWAPWFGKLPIDYNTVVNTSINWGAQWIYVLSKANQTVIPGNDYTLCGIRSWLYTDCSTFLHETKSGAEFEVFCGQDKDVWKPYSETKNASASPPTGNPPQKDSPMVVDFKNYKDISTDWAQSTSLGQGLVDANAAIARYLTSLSVSYSNETGAQLSGNNPSLAEGLAVLAGYTLLMASDVAPFVHYWPFDPNIPPKLNDSVTMPFEARLAYKDYSSGYDADWKAIFYVMLLIVLVLNVFCLGTLLYYFIHFGEVTDYTEPQNLFALAINSPQSKLLAGACGGGPAGEVLGKKWCVEKSEVAGGVNNRNLQVPNSPYGRDSSTHPHFYVRYPEEDRLGTSTAVETTMGQRDSSRRSSMQSSRRSFWGMPEDTQATKSKSRLSTIFRSRRNSSSDEEIELADEGAQHHNLPQYARLSHHRDS